MYTRNVVVCVHMRERETDRQTEVGGLDGRKKVEKLCLDNCAGVLSSLRAALISLWIWLSCSMGLTEEGFGEGEKAITTVNTVKTLFN